jgi:hypothetical protein
MHSIVDPTEATPFQHLYCFLSFEEPQQDDNDDDDDEDSTPAVIPDIRIILEGAANERVFVVYEAFNSAAMMNPGEMEVRRHPCQSLLIL